MTLATRQLGVAHGDGVSARPPTPDGDISTLVEPADGLTGVSMR